MALWLRQSTATAVDFGPFLDKTDGVTLLSGPGIIAAIDDPATGILLSKQGGTAAVRHPIVTPSVYNNNGFFRAFFSAEDTDSLGALVAMHSNPAVYLSIWRHFMVVRSQMWDALFATAVLGIWTYTLTNSMNGFPIPDADIWLTSDIAGAHILDSRRTDSFGVVTFYLAPGPVYVWRSKAGFLFANPDLEIVP